MVNLSIIILSYNTKELLKDCLTSIFEQIKGLEYEVIVVDNASQDDSVQMVKERFKKVKLVESRENLGFGNGVNLGVKLAKGKYLLFLNSDTEVLDDHLQDMVALMEQDKKIGVIGGKLKNADGSVQRSFSSFYTLSHVFSMLFGGDKTELKQQNTNKKQEVDWVSGGFMLIRRDLFEEIGGFDKHFFMYIEDMELCYRVKKTGHTVFFYPDAQVMHTGQGSSNRTFAIINIYKNLPYFYKKHKSYFEYILIKFLLVIKATSALLVGALTRNTYLVTTYRKALQITL